MLDEQVKNKLRDYQKQAFHFLTEPKPYVQFKNTLGVGLEYDDMGLGKTLTTMCSVEELEAYPCLIVGPKFALYVWQSEIKHWLGKDAFIYTGKPKEREKIWKEFIQSGAKYLITNYAMLGELAIRTGIDVKKSTTALNQPGTFKWGAIVWDEAHMGGLFNHKCDTYKVSLQMAKKIPVRYVLTGTPFRQGCVDLYGPLSLIDPEKFNSYWSYVNRYCIITKTPFGKEIERNPNNVVAFREMLNQYMVRRLKEEVLDELPGKLRQAMYVEMNPAQKKFYDELTETLIAEIPDSDDILITPSQMSLILRQRQILACPKILGLKDRGAAIDTIMEHSHLSMDEGKPIVVFTPFRMALPFLTEAFKEEYPRVKIYEIRGQLTAEEFGKTWEGFQTDNYRHKVMLCVIKSGASFQATAASTAYFLGYEWDFNMNEQAEDRLNRMGQKNFVNIYYLMSKGTADEVVAQRLNEKKSASNWVVGSDKQYVKMLKQARGEK